MTYSTPVTPSSYRRRRHVEVRRPYPPATVSGAKEEQPPQARKEYRTKPRGRRSGALVKKVIAPFCWSSVRA